MKNAEVWKHYKEYTRDVTEYSRKLAFAAGALCWFFKDENSEFPLRIEVSILFIVVFFISDILQGCTGAFVHRCWIRSEEKRQWKASKTIEGEYDKPAWIDYPATTFFLVKIFGLLVSFVFIGLHLFAS